jgi:hypothetical protein
MGTTTAESMHLNLLMPLGRIETRVTAAIGEVNSWHPVLPLVLVVNPANRVPLSWESEMVGVLEHPVASMELGESLR